MPRWQCLSAHLMTDSCIHLASAHDACGIEGCCQRPGRRSGQESTMHRPGFSDTPCTVNWPGAGILAPHIRPLWSQMPRLLLSTCGVSWDTSKHSASLVDVATAHSRVQPSASVLLQSALCSGFPHWGFSPNTCPSSPQTR